MRRDWLLISEVFGPTVQGEGPTTGQIAFFIRLGGCNQHCVWCDTPYTWAFDQRHANLHGKGKRYDPAVELKRKTVPQLLEAIRKANSPLVVVTGGEPLLQAEGVSQLVSACNEEPGGPRFEIETAGTVSPGELYLYENVRYNVSPKLENSGNPLDLRYQPTVLKGLRSSGKAIFKFVVDTKHDRDIQIDEIQEITEECGIPPGSIYLMPCGTDNDEITIGLKALAPLAISRGWNLSTRIQVTIWGDKRGH